MNKPTKKGGFDNWLATHPRQALQLAAVILMSVWQVPIAFLGVLLFTLLTRLLRLNWLLVLVVSIGLSLVTLFSIEAGHSFHLSLTELIPQGMAINGQFLRTLFQEGVSDALYFWYQTMWPYLFGFPLLVAGILATLELIPNSPHEKSLRALQRGQQPTRPDFPMNRITTLLSQLQEKDHNGTLLGVSHLTQKAVVILDETVNQIVLVLGTTGGGKTITLRRFYQRALTRGYPLIIVDGKPTDENVEWVMKLAAQEGRSFYGFNCGNFYHYDCLAHGGYTELKDKIISLKDEWESDYYRSIAEDYLQTTFEVLIKSQTPFDLKTVVDCLDYDELAVRVRATADEQLMNRVRRLEQYDRKDITGLQAHLNLLIHSELGQYFEKTDQTFSLTDVIQNNAVVYFALPALRFPGFAKVLGKLVINDIKAVVDRVSHPRIFTIFDEFSVFAGEQVLNLVNMGRGKGVHAIFGTQGLADLQKVDQAFANQVLNCVNTLICHRLNDQESAEAISRWVGTKDTFDVTAQISAEQGSTGMGSVRRNKEFIVHPDAIKQELQPGEAFYITKVGRFQQDKIKVKYS